MPKIILKDGSEFIVDQAILDDDILPAKPDEMIQLGKNYFKKSSIEIIHGDEKEKETLPKTEIPNKYIESKDKKESKKIESFGFWLSLLGFGIFYTPLSIIIQIMIGMESYDIFDMFYDFLILTGYIWLVYLMIKRRKGFKKWFIIMASTQITLIILGFIAISSESSLYSESELSVINSDATRSIIILFIWILYLVKSKKVKKVFIN